MSLVTDSEWVEYKEKFHKSYDADEDKKRRSLYEISKLKIVEHNKKFERGEVTFKMAINHFADLTEEEYAQRCGGCVPPK